MINVDKHLERAKQLLDAAEKAAAKPDFSAEWVTAVSSLTTAQAAVAMALLAGDVERQIAALAREVTTIAKLAGDAERRATCLRHSSSRCPDCRSTTSI